MSPISAELFGFLEELTEHNDRDWFQANKPRYEAQVKGPCLDFIAAIQPHIHAITPHIRVDKKAMFRIYRDVRFSKDKSPYKTHAALHFRHERAKDVHTPGFYLHLSPEACWFGCGIWRPESSSLRRIRERMVADPESWLAIRDTLATRGMPLGGDSLKRAPRGFDRDHPLIDELRRKDLVVLRPFTFAEVLAPGFVETYAACCRDGTVLMEDLASTLDLAW
jgi:uncharacterized protein (TIGR02453 family)